MKKSDWATIILIVAVVGLVSYFMLNLLFPVDTENPITVPTAASISSDVSEPSEDIYNEKAINPTVKATIGDQSNQQPFNLEEN